MLKGDICYPEDKIPFARLLPMGLQHVVAMFGATVLAPLLMGFNPQVALFFSGVGTLLFIAVTRLKVPSYLGSSFAFIGPVLAVTGGDASKLPFALCGIAGAGRRLAGPVGGRPAPARQRPARRGAGPVPSRVGRRGGPQSDGSGGGVAGGGDGPDQRCL